MQLTIPILVQPISAKGAKTVYRVRPLFFEGPELQHSDLERALETMKASLLKQLDPVWRSATHEALVPWSWCPQWTEHRIEGVLELKQGRFALRTLLMVVEAQETHFGYFPLWPGFWFELESPISPQFAALTCLTRWLKQKEKEEALDAVGVLHELPSLKMPHIQLLVRPLYGKPTFREKPSGLQALFGKAEPIDGHAELENVGRCLSRVSPHQLLSAPLRDAEVAELSRLLSLPERRPILLVGPPRVGKTAIVHEVIKALLRLQTAIQKDELFFQLAPDRLISGMSYVGQWEGRLTAILEHAKQRRHILFFDELLGLFRAGKSRDSNTSIGLILKGWLEQRAVRVVCEITPEALGVLREVDRGFVEQFHLLPVREPSQENTYRMLIHQLQVHPSLSSQLKVMPSALKKLWDLQARYNKSQAFPGKAVDFLMKIADSRNELATDYVKADAISRTYLRLYSIAPSMIGQDTTPADVHRAHLEGKIKGQPSVISTLVRVLQLASSGLADPSRPLACLLLAGPTGAGKTWSVKVLKDLLLSSPDALIRFDMNEFTSAYAVTRLIGTFDQPEGLLTAAVRRMPFSIILLDEIEKAHPDVFTLLLQVMGEGRLTDALGRTVDFTSTIVIMTSNLGVKESTRATGFGSSGTGGSAWKSAVESFFAPEFVNRLDEIVPFQPLTAEALEEIAELQLKSALRRTGLIRKKIMVECTPGISKGILALTRDQALGARALRRTVEQRIVEPVAQAIAGQSDNRPQRLRIELHRPASTDGDQAGPEFTFLRSEIPLPAPPARVSLPELSWNARQLGILEDRLRLLEEEIRAEGAHLDRTLAGSDSRTLSRLELLQQLSGCREQVAELRYDQEEERPVGLVHVRASLSRRNVRLTKIMAPVDVPALLATEDVREFLKSQAKASQRERSIPHTLLLESLRILEIMVSAYQRRDRVEATIQVETVNLAPPDNDFISRALMLLDNAATDLGVGIEPTGELQILPFEDEYIWAATGRNITGIQTQALMDFFCGLHLLTAPDSNILLWFRDVTVRDDRLGTELAPLDVPLLTLYSNEESLLTAVDLRSGERAEGIVLHHQVSDLLGDLYRARAPRPRWIDGLEALESHPGPSTARINPTLAEPGDQDNAPGLSPAVLKTRGRRS